jgi:hypothetical protein
MNCWLGTLDAARGQIWVSGVRLSTGASERVLTLLFCAVTDTFLILKSLLLL